MLPAFFAEIWKNVVFFEKIQDSIMKTDSKMQKKLYKSAIFEDNTKFDRKLQDKTCGKTCG